MESCSFLSPTRLVIGRDSIEKTPDLIKSYGGHTVLVACDSFIKEKTNLLPRVTGMLNEATAYSMQRKYPCGTYIDGKSLSELEPIQAHLTNIYSKSWACKALTFNAAEAMDAGEPDALIRILAARFQSINDVVDAGKYAMRVVGGKGYNKTTAVERMLRDGYAGQIMAPSADVLGLWIGRLITGQSPL